MRQRLTSILVEAGAGVNMTYLGSGGRHSTPLDVALARNNKACAKYLVSKGGVKASKLTNKASLKKSPTEQPSHSLEITKTRNSSKLSVLIPTTTNTDLTDTDSEEEAQESRSQSRKKRILRRKSRHSSPAENRTPAQLSNKSETFQDKKLMVLPASRFIKR